MATIYDVAEMAGVSIGTVSNYLNNKYVGKQKSGAIQQAIDALNYVPNRTARNLKLNLSNQVVLILPNLKEYVYCEIALGIVGALSARQYNVVMEFTGNSPSRERELIKGCINSTYTGVILCTCDPDNHVAFTSLQQKTPLIFLLNKPNLSENYSFLGFDNYEIIYRLTTHYLAQGNASLQLWAGPSELSGERACTKAFKDAFRKNHATLPLGAVVSLPVTSELIFRRAIRMFAEKQYASVILTSSRLCADTIMEAAYYQNISDSEFTVIALGEESWHRQKQRQNIITTFRPAQSLGREAAEELLKNAGSPALHEKRHRVLKDEFTFSSISDFSEVPAKIPSPAGHGKKLRILFAGFDSSVSAIQRLIPNFERVHSIEVEVNELLTNDAIPFYREMSRSHSSEYDIISADNPWLPELANMGLLLDITAFVNNETDLPQRMVPNVFQRLSSYKGSIYGLPYLVCAQLLFYRKDLFLNPLYQNGFFNIYHRPLSPPKDWFEYNLIAKYFTQKYNPDSPVEHGTVLGISIYEQLMADLFPRIWHYGAEVFDANGNLSIYSEEMVHAYNNYAECHNYCSPRAAQLNAPLYPQEFSKGNSAMAVVYSNQAAEIIDRSTSQVFDKVDFCPIPGNIPVLAGWNLCVNRHTKNEELAYLFFRWLASNGIAVPYTILGGTSPLRSTFLNTELIDMYPWLPLSEASFHKARPRVVPPQLNNLGVTESLVERILAEAALKSLRHPQATAQRLREAENQVAELIR